MRLWAALLALMLSLAACGGTDATSLARKACDRYESGIGVKTPPVSDLNNVKSEADFLPYAEKTKAIAAQAAKKDHRYDQLATLIANWVNSVRETTPLLSKGFANLSPSENAALKRLQAASEKEAPRLAAGCKKARS